MLFVLLVFRMSKKSKFASDEVFVAITPLQLDPAHAEEMLALAKGVPSFRQEDDKNLNGIHVCFYEVLGNWKCVLLDPKIQDFGGTVS